MFHALTTRLGAISGDEIDWLVASIHQWQGSLFGNGVVIASGVRSLHSRDDYGPSGLSSDLDYLVLVNKAKGDTCLQTMSSAGLTSEAGCHLTVSWSAGAGTEAFSSYFLSRATILSTSLLTVPKRLQSGPLQKQLLLLARLQQVSSFRPPVSRASLLLAMV